MLILRSFLVYPTHLLLIIVCQLMATYCIAAPSLKDYAALPMVSMVSISPSGTKVAFQKTTEEGKRIYVFSLTERKYLSATQIDNLNITSLYFINESSVVFTGYENKKVLGYRGSIDLGTAFIIDIKYGATRQLLTPGYGIYTGQSGLGQVVGTSKDGKYLLMPAFVAHDDSTYSSIEPNYALVATRIDKKSKPKIVLKGTRNSIDYFIQGNGEPIAEERFSAESNLHTIWANHNGTWEKIYSKEGQIKSISVVGLTPDYKSLIVLGEAEATDRTSYFKMSLMDGTLTGPLFKRNDADIESVLTTPNRVVIGVRYSGFVPSYKFFNEKFQDVISQANTTFKGHAVYVSDWTEDGKNWIFRVEGPTIAGAYYHWSEVKISRIAEEYPDITANDIHPVISSGINARDGLFIPTLLTIPQNKLNSLSKLPTVVMPHGGPESYDRMGFDWTAQAFAAQGYLVLQPQFRGSQGFGGDFTRAGYGEWGKKMQDDVTDSLNALIKEGLADPNRVCIVGASYGGYSALVGGAFTPELYKCVVSINGVTDINKLLEDEKNDHGFKSETVAYWEKIITNGDVTTERLDEVSPAQHAINFAAPVLLVHSSKDTTVKISQSEYMKKQLKKAKKDVTFIELKGDNHYLYNQESRLEALETMVNFVNKHIGNNAGSL